jgi:uncharacterized protein YqeY
MNLKDQITEDMKTYMREKDTVALGAVRMLRSEIKNEEINTRKELDDEGVQKVIATAIKKRKDAAEQFSNAGRAELAEKEMVEAEVLARYMPKQMEEAEVRAIVAEACEGVDTTDKKLFGKVMQTVMAKTKGRADGKLINQLVKDAFDGNN